MRGSEGIGLPLNKVGVRGSELHYVEAGEGPLVVLVHGTLGDYRSWIPQIGPFSENFRVVSYSRRYHHPNAWPRGANDYSASFHAEDLAGLIDFFGDGPAHVVSASYGSYVALVHAHRYPDQVRSLVVGEPPMLAWLESLTDERELARRFIEEVMGPAYAEITAGNVEEGIRRFIDGVHGRPGTFDRFSPTVRRMVLDNGREMEAEARSEKLFPSFGCEDAAQISFPVLLLDGERSPSLFRRITDELERCLPNASRETIPGVSHAMNAARPRAYNEAVLRFLKTH